MEISNGSALLLAMSACIGVSALVATGHNDPRAKQNFENTLKAVKEVLETIEKAEKDQNSKLAYMMLYDAYQKTLSDVNGFSQEMMN